MSKNHYIIPIFVPFEGCPHQCVFCNQDRITGVKNSVDGEKVREIIKEYYETIENKEAMIEVSFFGGTFTAINEKKQRELLSVAKEFKELGIVKKIRMSTRPDAISDYILSYLLDYKVDIIELGVQSLDDNVLRSAGRGHTVFEVYTASKLIKEYGITLGHQLMPGLPGSNRELDIMSAEKSVQMKPDLVRIYPSLVIKDTPMEKMYERGEYIPYTLEEAVDVSKEIYKIYEKADVNIIRVGLQATETINVDGDVVSGPFHPAFRELVESSIINENIKDALAKEKKGEIKINSKDLSKLYANKKNYFNKLLEDGYKLKITIDDEIKRGNFLVVEEKKNN
ncbi:MAG: elongator complex protein 3 [Clostridium sp.]